VSFVFDCFLQSIHEIAAAKISQDVRAFEDFSTKQEGESARSVVGEACKTARGR
jgi:hypothetical protein